MCKLGYCTKVKSILDLEKKIILEHIDKHKWYKQINNMNDAIVDFVSRFAWLMREVYCNYICIYRNECDASLDINVKNSFLEDISDGEIKKYIRYSTEENEDLLSLKIDIVKYNIRGHMWLNKIGTYPEAIRDFMDKFGWLIFAIYQLQEKENITKEYHGD